MAARTQKLRPQIRGLFLKVSQEIKGFLVKVVTISKPVLTALCHYLWVLKWLVLATVIFALVAYFTITENAVAGPLATLTPAMGTLVLTVFSKATDYALEAAVNTAWEFIYLGPMVAAGQTLLTHCLMTGNIESWLTILFNPPQKPGNTQGRLHRATPQRFQWLSATRIVIWLALQFPGIILMAKVNNTKSYKPVGWTAVGAGVGIYNTSSAVVAQANQPLVTSLVLNILKDTTVSVKSDPIGERCRRAGASCLSYVIPGGLQNVTPWPFFHSNDPSLTFYITEDAPAYQVDFWDVSDSAKWPDDPECHVYGVFDNLTFQLCLALNETRGEYLAGWRPCPSTLLPSNECNQPKGWAGYPMQATSFSIYRRTATVAASRETSNIVSVMKLGPPKIQKITIEKLFVSFDSLFLSFSNGSLSDICSVVRPNAQLTNWMAISLGNSYLVNTTRPGVDYLRNSIATSLFFFNPISSGVGGNYYAINQIQDNLPAENRVRGSLAKEIEYVAPDLWTVYAYIGVTGILLVLVFGTWLGTASYPHVPTSAFMVLDFLRLKWRDTTGPPKDLHDAFPQISTMNDQEFMSKAAALNVERESRLNMPQTSTP